MRRHVCALAWLRFCDFLPASIGQPVFALCFSDRLCQRIPLKNLSRHLKKKKQTRENKATAFHDSKNCFAWTHCLAAHSQQWKLYFLTPRGNALPFVSAAQHPAKIYFRAVVPQLLSRRLYCTPLIASSPKVFWIKQLRWFKFYLKHN